MLRQPQKRVKQSENGVRANDRSGGGDRGGGGNVGWAEFAEDYSASESPREASNVPLTRSSEASDLR